MTRVNAGVEWALRHKPVAFLALALILLLLVHGCRSAGPVRNVAVPDPSATARSLIAPAPAEPTLPAVQTTVPPKAPPGPADVALGFARAYTDATATPIAWRAEVGQWATAALWRRLALTNPASVPPGGAPTAATVQTLSTGQATVAVSRATGQPLIVTVVRSASGWAVDDVAIVASD